MFIVLADSRTGSHLLRSLLNDHRDLRCYDEILGLRKAEKDFYSLQKNEGCLVSYANLVEGHPFAAGNDIPRIMQIIRKSPVIHLTRDLTARAKSQLFYNKAKKKQPEKAVFRKANLIRDHSFNPELDNHDEAEVRDTIKMFKQRQADCLAKLWDVREYWLEITYEWLCGDQQLETLSWEKTEKICQYLQVPMTALTTNLYKIRKFGN